MSLAAHAGEERAGGQERKSGKGKIQSETENCELIDRAERGEQLLEKPDAGKGRCVPLRIKDAVLEREKCRRNGEGEESDGEAGRRETQRQGSGGGKEAQSHYRQQPAQKAAAEEKRDDIGGMVGLQPVSDIESYGGDSGRAEGPGKGAESQEQRCRSRLTETLSVAFHDYPQTPAPTLAMPPPAFPHSATAGYVRPASAAMRNCATVLR